MRLPETWLCGMTLVDVPEAPRVSKSSLVSHSRRADMRSAARGWFLGWSGAGAGGKAKASEPGLELETDWGS